MTRWRQGSRSATSSPVRLKCCALIASVMPDTTRTQSTVITSALPYANGEIHLGHIASTYLPADIFTRFLRLNGLKAYHICATDDFGTPILIRSEKEKKSPQEYVEYWNKHDKEDFESLGISFDFFDKTSSKENIEFVQYVFKQLHKNGHIYDQNVIQFYCTYDDKFLPDRYVIGRCPYCNAENQYSDLCEKCGRVPDQILEPKCAICGRPPIKKESKHYFFRLSNFGEELKDWLLSNQHLQSDVKNYVINWINEGLQDWDITRDLSWGVPIRLGINSEYKLPDYIPTRGHLMLQNQKISKSRNWYIGLKDFTLAFNPDFLRFYVASVVTYSQDDLNFDFDAFYERINNELIANIGNFINRALSFTQKYFQGIVPKPSGIDGTIEKELASTVYETGKLLSSNETDKSLKRILKYSNYMNHYFQTNSPWANKDTSNTTVYVSVNSVRSLALMLEPFIPFSCEKVWAQLKLGAGTVHQQNWDSA